ncbi:hypothetical protein FQN60_010540, partial [Etheostoma spectabile]
MAVSVAVLFLLLSFTAVTTSENTTSYDFNTTFGDRDVTYNATDNDAATQPTQFYSTAPTAPTEPTAPSPSGAVEPLQPSLAVSGRLLSPATDVGRLCPCDERQDVCDINCCCDPACTDEVALFTGCSVDTVRQ